MSQDIAGVLSEQYCVDTYTQMDREGEAETMRLVYRLSFVGRIRFVSANTCLSR